MAQKKYVFQQKGFSRSSMYSKLEQLPEQVFDRLFELMAQRLNVGEIRSELPMLPDGAIADSIPYVLSDEKCSKCGELIYYKYIRNSEKLPEKTFAICFSCGHQSTEECDCLSCSSQRIKVIHTFLDQNWRKPYEFDELSIFDLVNLLTVIELYYDSESRALYFHTLSYGNNQYGIPEEYGTLIRNLIDRKILIPAPNQTASLVTLFDESEKEDSSLGEFHYGKYAPVNWNLNITHNGKILDSGELYKLIP